MRALPWLLCVAAIGCASDRYDSQSSRSTAEPDARKLDRPFEAELAAASSLLYYDAVVTFRDRAGLTRLDTLGRATNVLPRLPVARVVLSRDEIAQVTHWPEVRFVEPNRSLRLSNLEGRALTRVDEVNALGYDGDGIEVAIIDTGADGTHVDLDDNLRKNYEVVGDGVFDTSTGATYVSTTPDGIDVETAIVDAHQANGVAWNTDDYGHGTHVFGTIAGTGEASEGAQRGMAPAATVDSYSTSAGISLFFVVQAYDHIIGGVASGATDVRVVSNSWGTDGCELEPDSSVNLATWTAYQEGILSVFAYGNDGPSVATCNPYATAPYVLGIAATDKAKRMAGFSSRGVPDAGEDRELALANIIAYHAASADEQASWDPATRPLALLRPSISAPGVDIVSAQNPLHPMTLTLEPYGAASGTSMATPHVSGIVALIADAYESTHGARLSPIDIIRLLEVTADKAAMFGYDTHDTGAGFVDARAAVDRAVAGNIPAAVTANDLVVFDPSLLRVERTPIAGDVLVNSWQTNIGYDLYQIVVEPGTFKVGAEVAWGSDAERVYLTLYKPGVSATNTANAAATSAALLNFSTTNSIDYLFPEPGVWTLRVDGRLNIVATPYTGATYTAFKDNAQPSSTLAVDKTRVLGGETVAVTATVYDADLASDVTQATLVLRDRRGHVQAQWDRTAFTETDARTLSLSLPAVAMSGPAPWTLTLTGVDRAGARTVSQVLIGRR